MIELKHLFEALRYTARINLTKSKHNIFMNSDEKIIEFINKAAPSEWWEYALELKIASEELAKLNETSFTSEYNAVTEEATRRPGVSRTYMLIIGICLENLIKGILIAENPDYIRNGIIDKSISTGHNLYNLSTKTKTFFYTERENQLMQILSDALPYWGKYPIPKKFDQIKKEIHSTPEIRETFLMLYKKLERHIYILAKNGWDGPNDVHIDKWYVQHLEN